MSEDEVLSVCLQEIRSAAGGETSDLAQSRADAMERYLGDPYGDEIEGRSGVVTREVLETVEGMMPSLMRIFAEQENLVQFAPIGPEDEEQAQQETDLVNYVFWNENRGFYNLYTFCKDALKSKTGVLKVWADRTESVEREEYKGLDDLQMGQLLADEDVEREVIEYDLTDEGHHVIFKTKRDDVKIKICPIAPEEFGVGRDARSPYVEDSDFVYARFKKTIAELVDEGYDRDFLETIASNDDIGTEERIARRNDEESLDWSDDTDMLNIWVTECWVRLDRDGDGIAELLKVTIAAGSYSESSGKVMDIEDVDGIPVFATPAVPITHKFYGLSIADLVLDLQRIQTTLLRQVLDNTYLANNGQTAVNTDYVNLEDLLTRRPGGLTRFKGDMPWNAVVGAIPHNQLPAQTSEVFERLDERQKRRTGYGDEVGALDPGALANVNTGVAALAFDQARAKIELLARIIAEIGLKPMFHYIHELMIKNDYKARAIRIRNQWIQADPSNWRTRKDSTITVGIGKVSRERRIMGFEALLAKQQEMVGQGAMGTLLQPHHLYESYKGWVEAWGFEPDLYVQDPRKLPPPPPKGPDPQAQLAQAQGQALMMDGQAKMMRAQTEQQKVALEVEKARVEAQYKQAESFIRQEVERVKADSARLKTETETMGKVASMQHESEMREMDRQLKAFELQLDQLSDARDRDLEWYKALATTGGPPESDEQVMARVQREQDAEAERTAKEAAEAQQAMERERREGERDALMFRIAEEVRKVSERESTPKAVVYDEKGLIKQIGDRAIQRDDSGRIVSVG